MSFFTTEKAEKAEGIERIPLADIPGGQVLRRSGWAVWNLLKEAKAKEIPACAGTTAMWSLERRRCGRWNDG